MPIYRLLENSAFGPIDVEAMAQAFEGICIQLELTREDDREIIARRVIECANLGTLNRQDICEMVLAEVHNRDT
jgi:hypothetical protein